MPRDTERKQARPGDLVLVAGHHVGETGRVGEILEVLGEPGHYRYRVRWDDDRESIFQPGSDAVVRHRRKAPAARKVPAS